MQQIDKVSISRVNTVEHLGDKQQDISPQSW